MHLRLRLLMCAWSTVSFRIIIVDVDIVIVYYLNDFARRAFTKLSELQLAKPEGIKLPLQLFIRVLCCSLTWAPTVLSCIPHKHLRMSLSGCILGSSAHLSLLV